MKTLPKFLPVIHIGSLDTSGEESNCSLLIRVSSLSDGMSQPSHEEARGGGIRINLKKKLCHYEALCDQIVNVGQHGEDHLTGVGEINSHAQVLMYVATCDAQMGLITEFGIQKFEQIINNTQINM